MRILILLLCFIPSLTHATLPSSSLDRQALPSVDFGSLQSLQRCLWDRRGTEDVPCCGTEWTPEISPLARSRWFPIVDVLVLTLWE